jgi:signal transduction histidine kinase
LPDQKDELYQLTFSINQLLNRIEAAMEREKQFTADASHELRTPLSVLRGTLEVLLRKPRTTEEYVEKIGLSIREIDRMHVIVEQLLTLARFDYPAKAPSYTEVALQSFIKELISRQQKSWSNNGMRVEVDCRADLKLNTDPALLEVILDNLISNAVKYSTGDSTVGVRVKDSPRVTISVIDRGIGIASEDLEKIFQPFYRSGSTGNSVRGTGLGLSLVQKACDQLSIELSVSSELSKGSTFTLQF